MDAKIVSLHHDDSAVTNLERFYDRKRNLEAGSAAYSARAAARSVLVKHAGIAALLAGGGIALACWGASFLIAPPPPKIITVTNEKIVPLPGKETIRETIREIPGPERIVTVTPNEKTFLDSPGFVNAQVKGRIVKSIDGVALSFDTGKNWYPVDPDMVADSTALVGLWAYCSPAENDHWRCYALTKDGGVIGVPQKKATRS